jgi:hypothetical protein
MKTICKVDNVHSIVTPVSRFLEQHAFGALVSNPTIFLVVVVILSDHTRTHSSVRFHHSKVNGCNANLSADCTTLSMNGSLHPSHKINQASCLSVPFILHSSPAQQGSLGATAQ